ncbi:MAG: AIR synthase-related protein, partial [Xenococcaceae cyanobacterium]
QCLTKYNTNIIGGDICRSTVITVAISAFGQVLPERVIRRDRAQVGDAIVVTGVHGASRAGLELLLHPEIGNNLTNAEREELIVAHQRPQPRLDVIQYLAEIETTRAIAGMDSSDGLADAIVQICRSSGVGATLDRRAITIPSVLSKLVAKEKLWEWVLYGGEDFELVLCLPPLVAEILIAKLRENAAIVGKITNNDEIILANNLDGDSPESLNPIEGFQHF